METSQTKIEKISLAHRTLFGTYIAILKKLEDKTIKDPFNFDRINPIQYFKDKQIGYYEKFQLIGKVMGYFSDKYSDKRLYRQLLTKLKRQSSTESNNLPTTVRIHKRLLTYFFKTHIRTKMVKLHRLYLREIVLQNKGEQNSKQIEELQGLDNVLVQYLAILPNPTKILGILFGVGIASTIGLLQFFHLDGIIYNKLMSLSIGDIAGGFLLVVVFGILFSSPLIQTFAIKRALFLKTNSWYDYLDIYLGKGDDLYKKSIYKLEDDLFEALDAKNTKPKESPVDFWIQTVFRGPLFIFFGIGIYKKLIELFIFNQTFTTEEISILTISGIVMPFAVFFYFISPLLEYRRRRKYNLL